MAVSDEFKCALNIAIFARDDTKATLLFEVSLQLRTLQYAPTVVGAGEKDAWTAALEVCVKVPQLSAPVTAGMTVFTLDL